MFVKERIFLSELTNMAVSHKKKGSTIVDPCILIKKDKIKMEIFWFILIIAAYFLLQGVILPKLGIST